MNTLDSIKKLLNSSGFTLVGWTPLSKVASIQQYKEWIEQGYAGEMTYLKDHLPQKENPKLLLPEAKSAILIAQNYYPHPRPEELPLKFNRIALYAKGQDYHYWLRGHLEKLKADLLEVFPSEEFLSFTDSLPVLERDLGVAAGLGWIGKNSCLINEKEGSLFFIGGLLTSLKLPPQTPQPDRCGTCTRCLNACPTGAFVEPRVLDATKCISYLTIESKTVAPLEHREKMGDWLFGCDICQTVCPWNTRIWKNDFESEELRKIKDSSNLEDELRMILRASHRELQKKFASTPLTRAGKRIKRTAIIVAANQKLVRLAVEIQNLKKHPDLKELCDWALASLNAQ